MANIYNEKAWIRYSQMPYKDAKQVTQIQENLAFLDKKLELAQRKLSMFDFYKITTYVKDSNDYKTAIDKLEPNTSFVCTENFVANNKNFGRGDIVYKYENGSIEHIRAERAGIYAPTELIKDNNNNNYTITYKYFNYEPVKETSTAKEGKAEFAKEMKFPITTTVSKQIYSIQQTLDTSSRSITFDKVTNVTPFVRFYNEAGEEVY